MYHDVQWENNCCCTNTLVILIKAPSVDDFFFSLVFGSSTSVWECDDAVGWLSGFSSSSSIIDGDSLSVDCKLSCFVSVAILLLQPGSVANAASLLTFCFSPPFPLLSCLCFWLISGVMSEDELVSSPEIFRWLSTTDRPRIVLFC